MKREDADMDAIGTGKNVPTISLDTYITNCQKQVYNNMQPNNILYGTGGDYYNNCGNNGTGVVMRTTKPPVPIFSTMWNKKNRIVSWIENQADLKALLSARANKNGKQTKKQTEIQLHTNETLIKKDLDSYYTMISKLQGVYEGFEVIEEHYFSNFEYAREKIMEYVAHMDESNDRLSQDAKELFKKCIEQVQSKDSGVLNGKEVSDLTLNDILTEYDLLSTQLDAYLSAGCGSQSCIAASKKDKEKSNGCPSSATLTMDWSDVLPNHQVEGCDGDVPVKKEPKSDGETDTSGSDHDPTESATPILVKDYILGLDALIQTHQSCLYDVDGYFMFDSVVDQANDTKVRIDSNSKKAIGVSEGVDTSTPSKTDCMNLMERALNCVLTHDHSLYARRGTNEVEPEADLDMHGLVKKWDEQVTSQDEINTDALSSVTQNKMESNLKVKGPVDWVEVVNNVGRTAYQIYKNSDAISNDSIVPVGDTSKTNPPFECNLHVSPHSYDALNVLSNPPHTKLNDPVKIYQATTGSNSTMDVTDLTAMEASKMIAEPASHITRKVANLKRHMLSSDIYMNTCVRPSQGSARMRGVEKQTITRSSDCTNTQYIPLLLSPLSQYDDFYAGYIHPHSIEYDNRTNQVINIESTCPRSKSNNQENGLYTARNYAPDVLKIQENFFQQKLNLLSRIRYLENEHRRVVMKCNEIEKQINKMNIGLNKCHSYDKYLKDDIMLEYNSYLKNN